MAGNLIFMIEGGKALELVKQHIAEKQRVARERVELARELGVEDIYVSNMDGVLLAVRFKGAVVHPEFKKPDRKGMSYPRARTAWRERFDAQKGFARPTTVIAEAFDIPLSISYADKEGDGHGWRSIGNPFNECGFLYLSKDGPYAMWIPDVAAEVKADIEKGFTVAEPALSFASVFDGCRHVEREEWDIAVAQHNLAKKRAQAEPKAAA